jgi:hypothetical protein
MGCDKAVIEGAVTEEGDGWATEALDEVRREAWRDARAGGQVTARPHGSRTIRTSTGAARNLKRARWALGKNPGNLTTGQQAKLAWIAKAEPRLYRAWLLKEGLRLPFQLKGEEGKQALASWLIPVRCQRTFGGPAQGFEPGVLPLRWPHRRACPPRLVPGASCPTGSDDPPPALPGVTSYPGGQPGRVPPADARGRDHGRTGQDRRASTRDRLRPTRIQVRSPRGQ